MSKYRVLYHQHPITLERVNLAIAAFDDSGCAFGRPTSLARAATFIGESQGWLSDEIESEIRQFADSRSWDDFASETADRSPYDQFFWTRPAASTLDPFSCAESLKDDMLMNRFCSNRYTSSTG